MVFQRFFVGRAGVLGRFGAVDEVEDYGRQAGARDVDFLVRGDVADGTEGLVMNVLGRGTGLWYLTSMKFEGRETVMAPP